MSALQRLTDPKSWEHQTEDYEAGLPEIKEYAGEFSDVKKAAEELAAKDAELTALRAERDEYLKFIKYLRYLQEAEDVNSVMWHIRKYEVKS